MIRRCEFKLVFDAVKRSGVGADCEAILVPTKTGRPRPLTAEVFFTGAVLCALEGLTLTLKNIHSLLTVDLAKSLQVLIGVRADYDAEPITVRQVRYLFEAIDRRFTFSVEQDPTLSDVEREIRSEALQSILDKLINATHPQSMPKQTAIAMDTSAVEAWAKSKIAPTAETDEADVLPHEVVDDDSAIEIVKRFDRAERKAKKEKSKKAKPERICHDPDAHGGYRTMTYDNKSNKFNGYDLFASVGVTPVGEDTDQWPKVLIAMTLKPAAGELPGPALAQIDRLISAGHPLSEVLVDRGFSYKIPEHWAVELKLRGISQVQDIHPLDQGVRDLNGMRIVTGVPHCPRMPDRLIDITRPQHFKVGPLKKKASNGARLSHERNTRELTKFHDDIAERQRYSFVFHENNPTVGDPFNTRWICPGKAGKIECSLCPMGVEFPPGTPVVVDPPGIDVAPKCCSQKTVSVPGPAIMKLRQEHYWGSPDYCESYSRRSNIEGVFGNLRNTSTQNIKRSFCRVSGLVKTSLMLAFEVVAANIRLVRQWAKRNKLIDDPLCIPMAKDHGFEELDENGKVSLAEPSFLDRPPDDLAQ
jgi:hypothetical protein